MTARGLLHVNHTDQRSWAHVPILHNGNELGYARASRAQVNAKHLLYLLRMDACFALT